MTPHSVNKQTLLSELNTNADLGLTSEQVLELRAKFGENKLQEKNDKKITP